MPIQWMFYPKSSKPTALIHQIVEVFKSVDMEIDSYSKELNSNAVLGSVSGGLLQLGFLVETGKSSDKKIQVPVLFGLNGKLEKSFDADAYHPHEKFVLEVEAGRGVVNYQFLKDFFQACMMNDVEYLAIAVRNVYQRRKDFEIVIRFFDTLYASNRLALPLKGILILGY